MSSKQDVGYIPNKFRIERVDGESMIGGKHEHCAYFVLDWNHDPFALVALAAYADACQAEFPFLAQDLRARVKTYTARQKFDREHTEDSA